MKPTVLDSIKNRYIDACILSKEYYKARQLLERIPTDRRSLKDWKQLAIIYDHFSESKNAIECYKSIVRKEPFALEAIVPLINYGVSFKELKEMIPPNSIIYRIAHVVYLQHSNQFQQAINELTGLEEEYKQNPFILSMLAETYYRAGNDHESKQVFIKLRRLEPTWIEHIDIFCYLLRQEGSLKSLERVVLDLEDLSQDRVEYYTSLSTLHDLKGDYDLALSQVEKAIQMDSRYVFAHQLKGQYLSSLNRFGEASLSYRNAYIITRDIQTYEGLVKCYLQMGKMVEATTTAKEALALLPSNRATCLAAVVMSHNPTLQNKAREYFEKALGVDPSSSQSLFGLADLYVLQGNIKKAIELLQAHKRYHHTDTIHEKLGMLYLKMGEYGKANEEFGTALKYIKLTSINGENNQAREGMREVERMIQGDEESDAGSVESMEEE